MSFKFVHNNFNVRDLEKSLAFYKEALGLDVVREHHAEDGSFTLVYLGDSKTSHQLELTWLRDWDRPYNLGDNEFHLAFETDCYEESLANIKKWDVSVSKTKQWESTLLKILMDTGWKLFLQNSSDSLLAMQMSCWKSSDSRRTFCNSVFQSLLLF